MWHCLFDESRHANSGMYTDTTMPVHDWHGQARRNAGPFYHIGTHAAASASIPRHANHTAISAAAHKWQGHACCRHSNHIGISIAKARVECPAPQSAAACGRSQYRASVHRSVGRRLHVQALPHRQVRPNKAGQRHRDLDSGCRCAAATGTPLRRGPDSCCCCCSAGCYPATPSSFSTPRCGHQPVPTATCTPCPR
jgi:hypothetical protein